jgi:replicative DNA helicase
MAGELVDLTSRTRLAEPWPVLGAHKPLPEFPVDALPSDIGEWIVAVSEETQTPLDLAAMAALGVLAAVAQGGAVVDCGSWSEELALYLLVAMPSGDRKSTVLRKAVAPLRAIERERSQAAAPAICELRSRRDILEVRKRKLTKTAGESPDAEARTEAQGELARVDEELAEIGDPVSPRLLADDATPEALGQLLAQHGSIAVVAAESALIDNLSGRYNDGAANLHLVCSAYSGEPTSIDRRGRDPEMIDRPLMTVALAVQPHVLRKLVSHPIARDQGLVARFAVSMPETQLGRRKIDAPPAPRELHDAWEACVRRVADASTADINDTDEGSVSSVSTSQGARLTLAPAAAALLHDLRAEQEPRLSEAGDLRPIADWAARHPGRVARIAGLLHLAQHPRPLAQPISDATMRDALRIGAYLLAHGLAALTGPDEPTRRALQWLAGRAEDTVTVRDLQRGPLGSRGTAEQASKLAALLVQHGALRLLPDEPADGPGKPASRAYAVHPELAEAADTNDRNPAAGGGATSLLSADELFRRITDGSITDEEAERQYAQHEAMANGAR